MNLRVKNVLKRLEVFSLIMALCMTSAGITALADCAQENQIVISDEFLFEERILTDEDEFAVIDNFDEVEEDERLLDEELSLNIANVAIASASNLSVMVVTTATELASAVALVEDGAVIEIGNDIYLSERLYLDKSITLQGINSVEPVTIYSANNERHFVVEGDEIALSIQNIKLDGNGLAGGIASSANHLMLSDAMIYNCFNTGNGGAIEASGDITVENCEITNNETTKNGGGIAATRNVTIVRSLVEGNTAVRGGGLYSESELEVTIDSCHFRRNSANSGGGIALNGQTTNIIATSRFSNNQAKQDGGGMQISFTCPSTYIFDCDIAYNAAIHTGVFGWGGGISTGFHDDSMMLIQATRIYSNFASGSGGGIHITNAPDTPANEEPFVIANSTITNNMSMGTASSGAGGGIFTNYSALKWLTVREDSIIKDNYARVANQMTAERDIRLHDEQIDSTTSWSEGFDYAYNNLDIAYVKGTEAAIHTVMVQESFFAEETIQYYALNDNDSFHYEFLDFEEYKVIVESNVELEVEIDGGIGQIDIAAVNSDVDIFIHYRPLVEEELHTITITTSYLDGIQADQTHSYHVKAGASFEQTYDVLEGYELAGFAIFSFYPWIDGDTQTVCIEQVEDDFDIVVYLVRKVQTVKITTQYIDGIRPDETKSYSVLYGDDFAEHYDALEGYILAGFHIRSYPLVDGENQMVYIDEVKEDFHIFIQLVQAEYNVKITVRYPEGTIADQVFTYTVLYGESFLENFEVADGYRIVGGQAEKGVSVNFLNQTVGIERVTKDMEIIIICK